MAKDKLVKPSAIAEIAQTKIDTLLEFYNSNRGKMAEWDKQRITTGANPKHRHQFTREVLTTLCVELKRQGELGKLSPPGKSPGKENPTELIAWNAVNKHYQRVAKGCDIIRSLDGPTTSLPTIVKVGKQGKDVDCTPIVDKDDFLAGLPE